MKKIFSAIALCITLMMTMMIGSQAAMFTDVSVSTPYRDAIITLSTIGLIKGYSDGSFKPDNTITRAEFTVMVTRALAVDSLKVEGEIFSDVENHYAKYNIRTAYDMGIINGMGDGTFAPDAPVTYEQAVKMIVCMLGYGDNAESLGGYPDGYMRMGANLNLTGKISMTNSDPAPRGVIAQLIYSALDVKIQNRIILADGTPSYAETQQTLLEGKLKMHKLKGMVIGVGDSKMDICTERLLDDEMAIYTSNNTKLLDYTEFFATHDTKAEDYLGYEVTIYYKEKGIGELDAIVAFDSESKKNDTITFTYDKIDSCSTSVIKYEDEKGRTKSLRFSEDNLNVIYNGKAVDNNGVEIDGESYDIYEAISEWLDPSGENFIYGEVKIVDTLSDDTIDILTINDYDVMIASKAPTTSDYRLTDKLVSGNYVVLNPDDSAYEFTVTRNGSTSAITSIMANDIVLIAKSLDSTKYEVIASSQTKTGKITSLDYAEEEITIDDVVYTINPSLEAYFKDKDELEVGVQGEFYVDKFNNVIYCDIQESQAAPYGYLINLTYDDETEVSYASVFVPSLTSAVKSYQLDDKIKINGDTTNSYESRLEETSELCVADIENSKAVYGSTADDVRATKYAQPVRVDISSQKIKGFVSITDEGKVNESKSEIVRYLPFGKYKYSTTNNFDNQFYINSSTLILYVPGNRMDKDEYSRMTAASIFKVGESYWVEPYDVNESKTASLVVVYGNSSMSEITKDSPINIVSKKPMESIVNDETIHRVTMYTTSSISAVTKNAADDKEFEDLEVGDVFQFGYNNKSAMINKQILIRGSDVVAKLESEDYDWTNDAFMFRFTNSDGEVEMDSATDTVYHRAYVVNVLEVSEDEENQFIRVTRSAIEDDGTTTGDEERFILPGNVKIIRFNTEKNIITNVVEDTTTKLTADDLRDAKYSGTDCSKILIDVVKGEIKYIMIYD